MAVAVVALGDGTNHMPVVHVDDLADAYVQALDRATAGTILNVVGGSVTGKDLARSISFGIGQGGTVVPLAPDEAQRVLGPAALALTMDLSVSGLRMAHMLGWTPSAPSLLYEILHGSLRPMAAT
jgi:nucleoside-diphosphate-sugar epimerase